MTDTQLFLALSPDAALRAQLADLATRLLPHTGGRCTPHHHLHLTLAFLGPVPAERVAELQAALAELPVPSLRLALGEWGFWLPGIAWLAPRQPCAALMTLAEGLRDLLDEHGFRFDRKPFRPHITLIRRAHRPLTWPAPAQLSWTLREFCLFASQPGPQGVQYRVLARFA